MITERIDGITRIDEAHRDTIIPVPRSVKIELTNACDFKCFFCATSRGLRRKGHMDFELFKRIAGEAREAGVEELGMFYLGESMLYPQIVEAVEYAKQTLKFPYVFLTSNARMATANKVKKLMLAGLDSLKWSFNSANAEQMEEITGVNAWAAVNVNIRMAMLRRIEVKQKTGHHCGLYASSILYDGEQGERMKEAVKKILPYIDQHYWLPLYNQGGHTETAGREKGLAPTAGNQGRLGHLVPSLPCWAVFTEGHVTYDGKLSACCFDHKADWTM